MEGGLRLGGSTWGLLASAPATHPASFLQDLCPIKSPSAPVNFLGWPLLLLLFIYFWVPWVFVAARGLSLVAASGGYYSLWFMGFSLWWLLLLWSTVSRHMGFSSCALWALSREASLVVVPRLSCSVACGIFLDQGSNPCPLPWQADSYPLRHEGSPLERP